MVSFLCKRGWAKGGTLGPNKMWNRSQRRGCISWNAFEPMLNGTRPTGFIIFCLGFVKIVSFGERLRVCAVYFTSSSFLHLLQLPWSLELRPSRPSQQRHRLDSSLPGQACDGSFKVKFHLNLVRVLWFACCDFVIWRLCLSLFVIEVHERKEK